MRNFFRWLIKIVAGLLALALVAVVVCIVIGVTVDLSFLRSGVEASAKSALGREVKIQGPVVFEFSNWSAIEVRDVQIANVPNATKPEFLKAGLARLQIGLFPLLKGEILIGEITAEDVSLNLENNAKGQPNWVFGKQKDKEPASAGSDDASGKQETTAKPPAGAKDRRISFGGLDKLSLKQVAVTYHDAALGKTFKFQLNSMVGKAPPGEPITLDFKGHLQKNRYDLKLRGGPIDDLLEKTEPWAFTLTGEVAGKQISTKGDMVVRNQQPEINLAFGIKDVDVGAILSALGLVEGLEASMGDAGIKLSVNGASLKQIMQQSSMAFTVKGGKWKVTLPNTQASFDITGLSGAIRVEKGNALTMDLKGSIEKTPVKLRITGSPLVDYVAVPDEIPLTIEAELAKMRLYFSSKLALPATSRNLKLALKISGDRLDNLNDLLRLDLPPIGPLFLDTRLDVSKQGYELSTLKIKVGESRLRGKMRLDTSRDKPKLDIKLVSDLIRIEDFDRQKSDSTADQTATVTTPSEDKKSQKTAADDTTEKQAKGNKRNLLSYEVLSRLNADIKVEARQVTSGKDKLGSASIKVSLKDSRLAVDPLRMDVPGGGVQVDFDYLPTENDVTVNLKTNIEKFDIGIMARRAKPETDMGGIFSLDAELHSTTPDLKRMMENARGHFDFALAPKNFSAGIIDLWAVNLLSAIMSKTSEKDQSEINCLVVRFDMQEGLMKEKAIYMDTTKMRIAGKAQINFKTRKLDIVMAPKAKKPEFFSLAVPIKVHGTFDDFGLGIGAGRLAGSVFSFITSPIHVPLRRIFAKKVPEDGRDACLAIWTQISKKKESREQEKP